MLTLNGRLTLWRRRYAAPGLGSQFPLDPWLDWLEDTVSLGLRELACRLNLAARNFDKAAENLARTAQLRLSGELLRQLVEVLGNQLDLLQQPGVLRFPHFGRRKACGRLADVNQAAGAVAVVEAALPHRMR